LILGGFWLRRRQGALRPGEPGLVLGCLALVAIFLVSWPLLMLHSAFAVQLQLSRVFWMADLLAFAYVAWIAVEAWQAVPARTASPALTALPASGAMSTKRAQIVTIAVMLLAASRGWYVLRHDHPGRPLVEIDLPADDWTDVGRWLREHTPHDAIVLADPGHAWRFGTSLRVSAERDVLIEDVKDIAIGMYDRGVAIRNMERRAALGDYGSLSPAQFQILATRYDLQYLVTDRSEPFDEIYRNARFYVYRLK